MIGVLPLSFLEDDNFRELSVMSNLTSEELQNTLMDTIKSIDPYLDIDFAGAPLLEWANNGEHCISILTEVLPGVNSMVKQELVEKIKFWGSHDDCPECGCEMEFFDYHELLDETVIVKCTQCKAEEDREKEY